MWPIFGGIRGIFSWLCSSLLRPWDKWTCARRQKADFKRTLLTRASSEFGMGCLCFVFPLLFLCWWYFNVFVFLFLSWSTIFLKYSVKVSKTCYSHLGRLELVQRTNRCLDKFSLINVCVLYTKLEIGNSVLRAYLQVWRVHNEVLPEAL